MTKDDVKLSIKNKKRYMVYSLNEKEYFDGMFVSVLQIFPEIESTVDQQSKNKIEKKMYEIAENFSFEATDTFATVLQKEIKEKLKLELEIVKRDIMSQVDSKVNTEIDKIKSTLATSAGTATA